ncbi:MAG TPA: VOC family protein [Actinomycetota bacterium]|nr:VOC family protein [Actinomycetota bacterium]
MITGAKFVSLNVSDYDRALAFYRDVLGFEVLADAPYGEEMGGQAGDRWIQVGPKGAQTSIQLQRDPENAGGWAPVVFDADDIVATCEDLKAKGVEVTQEAAEMPWGWWAQFKDPDGNEFGLGQSRG